MNKYYSIVAPAKLNLNLFVGEKNINGYHLLKSHICFLELVDKISIRLNKHDIFFQNPKTKSLLIDSKDNLILRAVNKFRSLTDWNVKFQIYLDKKIPIGAGLGGGSADAAATLILLRRIYNSKIRKIPLSSLYEIAIQLGSDVPACLKSCDLKIESYGEIIKRAKISKGYYFLLINPNIKLSTKDIFEHFSNSESFVKKRSIYFENINIENSLLSSAIVLAPQISKILSSFQENKNIIAHGMSGSGSTCFAIFKDFNKILPYIENFKKNINPYYFIWFGQKKEFSLNRISSSKTLENKF